MLHHIMRSLLPGCHLRRLLLRLPKRLEITSLCPLLALAAVLCPSTCSWGHLAYKAGVNQQVFRRCRAFIFSRDRPNVQGFPNGCQQLLLRLRPYPVMLPGILCGDWQFKQRHVKLCRLYQQENTHASHFHCSRQPISLQLAAF